MRNNKTCVTCSKIIPPKKKRSAKYCSFNCSYSARLERSIKRYNYLKEMNAELKRNESILEKLYVFQVLQKLLLFEDLVKMGFDFGICQHEFERDKLICKKIGRLAYRIDPKTKIVTIWKLY